MENVYFDSVTMVARQCVVIWPVHYHHCKSLTNIELKLSLELQSRWEFLLNIINDIVVEGDVVIENGI